MIKKAFGVFGSVSTIAYSSIVLLFFWKGIEESVRLTVAYGPNAVTPFFAFMIASIGAMISLAIAGLSLGALWKSKGIRILAIFSVLSSLAVFAAILVPCVFTATGVTPDATVIVMSEDTGYSITSPRGELTIVVNCYDEELFDIGIIDNEQIKYSATYDNGTVSNSSNLYDEEGKKKETIFDKNGDGLPDSKMVIYPTGELEKLYPRISWNKTEVLTDEAAPQP